VRFALAQKLVKLASGCKITKNSNTYVDKFFCMFLFGHPFGIAKMSESGV
jgi:hypothetical protein